jgi:hypothetical protein
MIRMRTGQGLRSLSFVAVLHSHLSLQSWDVFLWSLGRYLQMTVFFRAFFFFPKILSERVRKFDFGKSEFIFHHLGPSTFKFDKLSAPI